MLSSDLIQMHVCAYVFVVTQLYKQRMDEFHFHKCDAHVRPIDRALVDRLDWIIINEKYFVVCNKNAFHCCWFSSIVPLLHSLCVCMSKFQNATTTTIRYNTEIQFNPEKQFCPLNSVKCAYIDAFRGIFWLNGTQQLSALYSTILGFAILCSALLYSAGLCNTLLWHDVMCRAEWRGV